IRQLADFVIQNHKNLFLRHYSLYIPSRLVEKPSFDEQSPRGADMGRKDTEKEIVDSRAVTVERVRYTLAELPADAEASGAYPLLPEEREWVDAPAVGCELLLEDLQS